MRKYLLLIPLLLLSTAIAKSYYYESINLDVTVLDNGDLKVVEEETFVFDGSFTYVYRNFYDPVYGFKVSDESGELSYTQDGNEYMWTGSWIDTTKTFTLEYIIKDPFLVIREYDQLYYTIVFIDRTVRVGSSTSRFHFPKKINFNETSYRINRPGSVTIIDNKTLEVYSDNIPITTALDFEITLPKGVINPPNSLKNVITMNPEIISVLVALPFIFLIILVIKSFINYFEQKKDLESKTKIYKKVRPEELPPAIAGLLIDYSSGVKEVTATIIDLAVKGYIYMHKIIKPFWPDEVKLVKTKSDFSRLNAYEKKIMETIFDDEKEVSMNDLKRKFNPTSGSRPLKKIDELIQEEAVKLELAGKKIKKLISSKVWSIVKPTVASLVILMLYFFFGFIGFVIMSESLLVNTVFLIGSGITFIIQIVSLIITSILGAKIIRLKPKGIGAKKTYKQLRKFIKEHPLTDGRIFDTYLPYAIAMGVQKKWVKKAEELNYQSKWHDQNISTGSIIVLTSSMSSSVSPSGGGAGGGGGFGGGGGAGGGGGGAG